MSTSFSPAETDLEKWRALLLESLDVAASPATGVCGADAGLYRWFPEYSINVYGNLITRHLPLWADKHCLKTFDGAGNYTAYTYGEVDSLVRVVAATLDLPPQGKLAVIGGPTIETAVLVLASAFLGCHHTVVIASISFQLA